MLIPVGVFDGRYYRDDSVIKNISGGGIGFHTAEVYMPGSQLHIDFRTPQRGVECYLSGVVVRSQRDPLASDLRLPNLTSIRFPS